MNPMQSLFTKGKFIACLCSLALPFSAQAKTFLHEDFESVTLGDSVDEEVEGKKVWTKTAPDGWLIDDTGMAGLADGLGVTEWRGWSFASKEWWAETAGDQRRSEFSKATGVVAIADPDEWDDAGNPASAGTFNSFLSREIDITGASENSLVLEFDSSFRPEGNQKASVTAIYDGGAPVAVLEWIATSDDKTDEHVKIELNNPGGASEMTLTFGMSDAGNNWFWAIDNVDVGSSVLFSEDFEDLELGDPIDENFEEMVWTKTAPPGWEIDDSGVPSIEDDEFMDIGVTEWEGWSFANKEWWTGVAGDQRRSEFLKGQGTVAIMDPDEWDDKGGPFDSLGPIESSLSTPAIELGDAAANTLLLTFDSSWRPEFDSSNQSVDLTVRYDNRPPVVLFTWISDPDDDNFKDEDIDGSVLLPLNNPNGAKTMVITWRMFDAGNDWWWAIDNIIVSEGSPVLVGVNGGLDFVSAEIADTGIAKIDQDSIKMSVDGTEVATAITSADGSLFVRHEPDSIYLPGSEHTYAIESKDTLGAEWNWSGTFQVSPPDLPFQTPLPGADYLDDMWAVRYIFDAGTMGNLDQAVAAILAAAEPDFAGQKVDVAQPFMDQGTAGIFSESEFEYPDEIFDNDFWTGEDFVVFGHGFMEVPKTATYTIGVHSDDGMAVRIFGAEFTQSAGAARIDSVSPDTWAHPGTTGDVNSRAVVALEAGRYEIEFIWYERGGGDHGEVYAVEGEALSDEDTDEWALIGDTANGGFPMVPGGSRTPFQIIEIDYTAAGAEPAIANITWTSKEDTEYTIETSTNLQEFEELTDGYPSGGEKTSFEHKGAEGSERFYRVKKDG